VLEAASVVGKEFFLGVVRELAPDDLRADVPRHVMTLVRKEFVRPERSRLSGEDAFRFRHLLIRDAAYDAMPKAVRADLHERVATWLERVAGDRIAEQQEVLGYHLERAYAYLSELGPIGERGRALAERASRELALAGERAADRGDYSAAGGLLARAAALRTGEDRSRVALLLDAAVSHAEVADYATASDLLSDAGAAASGDPVLEIRVAMERVGLRSRIEPIGVDELVATGERAIPILEEAGDEVGLARAWLAASWRGGGMGDYVRGEEASRQALEHALRSGDHRAIREALMMRTNVTWGPMPVADAPKRLDEVRTLAGDDRLVLIHVETARAAVQAMSGEFAPARDAWSWAYATASDLGVPSLIGFIAQEGWLVYALIGDHVAAERVARDAHELLIDTGDTLQTIAADQLSASLYELDRLEEAEELTHRNELATMDPMDPFQAGWHLIRGKILARRGEFDEGERLARHGVKLLQPTQYLIDRGFAHQDLAEVLRLAGRRDESATELDTAIELFEQKGCVVSAERARALLADLPTGSND
jgi:tetratricopeptide (TPR) repeat protein